VLRSRRSTRLTSRLAAGSPSRSWPVSGQPGGAIWPGEVGDDGAWGPLAVQHRGGLAVKKFYSGVGPVRLKALADGASIRLAAIIYGNCARGPSGSRQGCRQHRTLAASRVFWGRVATP